MLANAPKSLISIEEAAQRNLNILKQEMRTGFENALLERTVFLHIHDPLRASICIRTDSSGLILELAAREDQLQSGDGSFIFTLQVESSKDVESSKFDFFAEDTRLSFSSFGTKLAVGRRMAKVCEMMSAIENAT